MLNNAAAESEDCALRDAEDAAGSSTVRHVEKDLERKLEIQSNAVTARLQVEFIEKERTSKVELPRELLEMIVPWIPPCIFLATFGRAAHGYSLSWYSSFFPHVVIVPDDAPTINAGINALTRGGNKDPGMAASAVGSGFRGGGLVLVRPRIYKETVRVTRNCYVLGVGPRKDIVVEAPGWESALVFSGLGQHRKHDIMDMTMGSGEDACIVNLTFRCRNEQMWGRCVYIVLGCPLLERCDVYGTIQVCGTRTEPRIVGCDVHSSRGSGLHLTDHCHGLLSDSRISRHGRHGVLVDRGACPKVIENRIMGNRMSGIRFFHGAQKLCDKERALSAREDMPFKETWQNIFEGNGQGDVSFSPHFADAEEDGLDGDVFEWPS